MNSIEISKYNLYTTLMGGQAFNWELIDGIYYGFTQDKIIKLKSDKNKLLWQTYPNKDNFTFLNNYLQLDINYDNILNNINKDQHISEAIITVPSVRLLKQDLEQTLLSFILTSHKNIKAVRKSIRDLSKKYGEKINIEDHSFYLFPKTNVLAQTTEKELRNTGIGFRANYLLNAAKILSSTSLSRDLLNLNLSEEEARQKLLQIKGIGEKIADCILTFSLGYYTVTPLDIWGKRVLTDLYGVDPKMSYPKMREWYRNYFGEYTAWAGQFLFEYLRNNYSKGLPKNNNASSY